MTLRRRLILVITLSVALILMGGVVVVLTERSERVADYAVPTSAELTSVARSRILFAHQSVGDNILGGVRDLFEVSEVGPIQIVETSSSVGSSGEFVAHTHIGTNGDPLGKLRDFETVLAGPLGDDLEVALIKLCYVDVVAATDVGALFNAYAAAMDRLEAEHPKIAFVYTTVPLTTDRTWKSTLKSWLGRDDEMAPDDNIAREHYNRLIRERYADTGRLFDIAAVESGLLDEPSVRTKGDRAYYVLNRALSIDAGHLNDVGSRAAAAKFIQVVAAALASQ